MKGIYTVYRFKDIAGNVLYVGRSVDLRNRISSHFSKNGHLPTDCYIETNEIDYIELDSEIDMIVHELVLINRYRPPYNTADRYEGETIIEVDDLNWEVYHNFLNEEIDKDRERFIKKIEGREKQRKQVLKKCFRALERYDVYSGIKKLNDTLNEGIGNELETTKDYSMLEFFNEGYFVSYTSSNKSETIVSGYKNNGVIAFKSKELIEKRGSFYFYVDDEDEAQKSSLLYNYLKDEYPKVSGKKRLIKCFTLNVSDRGEIIDIYNAPPTALMLLSMNAYHRVI